MFLFEILTSKAFVIVDDILHTIFTLNTLHVNMVC